MNKIVYSIIAVALLTTSCSEWFDVTPSSEMRAKDHYKTVEGFQQTLVGCYMAMADEELYGMNLSWYATELMGHQFRKSFDSKPRNIYEYNYAQTTVTPIFENAWARLYNVIANANEGLRYLEEQKSTMNPINYAIIRGEFLAIRAYAHFDLLRLYGYGDWKKRRAELSGKLTIPYVTKHSKKITPQATGLEVYSYLKKDLEEAATLLKEYDPVSSGKTLDYYDDVNVDGFYRYRGLHLNYYAVKGLQARVHTWFGMDMTAAREAAQEVISFVEAGGYLSDAMFTHIRLLTPQMITKSNASMTAEALFALQVPKLDEKTAPYFVLDYAGENNTALTIAADVTEEIFEGINTDVRYSKLMQQAFNSSPQTFVTLKLFQGELASTSRNRVNMIRIPEMYYITAEALVGEGDTAGAIEVLNKFRTIRGIYTPLESDLSTDQIHNEIYKEYRKEFIAEGVMFYFYKRLGQTVIPGLSEGEEMTDRQYVVPYPLFEVRSGRIQ